MLGPQGKYVQECIQSNFIGADFGINIDLTNSFLGNDLKSFNQSFIPQYLDKHPEKSKIAAGQAGSTLWTISNYLQDGDILLCPNGAGRFSVAEINGNYHFVEGAILPHRRSVKWLNQKIDQADMSSDLQRTLRHSATLTNLASYASEIESLLSDSITKILDDSSSSDDLVVFAFEKYLENFLVQNWDQTELGKDYEIFESEEGNGQQFPVDTGNIDILAISKDKKELLVVELKRGKAADAAVGQILRYMSYVKDELAEDGQSVKGIIIALDDDQKIRRALSLVPDVGFFRYQMNFKLLD